MRSFRDRSGATLVELLLSSSVLVIVMVALIQQRIYQKAHSVRQYELDAEASMVQVLLDQIRSRVEVFPKSFRSSDSSDYPDSLEKMVEKLNQNNGEGWTYVWSENFFGLKDQLGTCSPACLGRAFYLIDQMKVCKSGINCSPGDSNDLSQYYSGLYRVRLVVYHPKLLAPPHRAKEYFFTVSSR